MDARYILETFWGTKANCVVVAFIKAFLSLRKRKPLLHIIQRGKYVIITMPDGRTWCFTKSEINELNFRNNIHFRRGRTTADKTRLNELKATVRILYAVVIRSLQVKGYEGRELTQSQAKHLVNREGMRTSDFHLLMGIRRTRSLTLTVAKLRRMRHQDGILLYNRGHIIAAASGVIDQDGETIEMENEIPVIRRRKMTHYFRLKV